MCARTDYLVPVLLGVKCQQDSATSSIALVGRCTTIYGVTFCKPVYTHHDSSVVVFSVNSSKITTNKKPAIAFYVALQ